MVLMVLRRAIILYAVLFLIYQALIDRATTQAKLLNAHLPAFDDLIACMNTPSSCKAQQWEPYVDYYRAVLHSVKDVGAPNGILGVCLFNLGKPQEAIAHFEKARAYNPKYFWFSYDLGIVYAKTGNYAKAMEYLQQALGCEPQASLIYITLSKTLKTLLPVALEQGYIPDQNLHQGIEEATRLLIASYYRLRQYDQGAMLALKGMATATQQKDFYLYYAGLCAFELKDFMKAVYFFQECLKINPDHADATDRLAQTLKASGQETVLVGVLEERARALRRSGWKQPPLEEALTPKIF